MFTGKAPRVETPGVGQAHVKYALPEMSSGVRQKQSNSPAGYKHKLPWNQYGISWRLVRDEEGTPTDEQHWLFAGQKLEDGRTLASYNISEGSTVNYHIRLRGSDVRLKKEVVHVSNSPSGLPIYQFKYRSDGVEAPLYQGVLAQDLL